MATFGLVHGAWHGAWCWDRLAPLLELTDALCEAVHPGLRDHTWVIVEGHNPKNWGLGGKPWPVGEMPPGPGPSA